MTWVSRIVTTVFTVAFVSAIFGLPAYEMVHAATGWDPLGIQSESAAPAGDYYYDESDACNFRVGETC